MRKEIEALEDHADMIADLAQVFFRGLEPALAALLVVGGASKRQLAFLERFEVSSRMRRTVDLPEPDGPISVTFSPFATLKLKWSSTVRIPKRLVTSENSMMGGSILSVIARVFLRLGRAFCRRWRPAEQISVSRRKISPTSVSGTQIFEGAFADHVGKAHHLKNGNYR